MKTLKYELSYMRYYIVIAIRELIIFSDILRMESTVAILYRSM